MDKKWAVFLLVSVSIFMSTLDSSIVNVALPYIMADLATDIASIQWVVLSYLLTVSSLLLTFGRLSDIHGRRPIYVTGFFVFTLGSLLCGMASGDTFLIASRSIQGIGASMLMACSPALITDAFDNKERGRALGMVGAVVAAGLTMGPVIGGAILEYFSWRVIFYVNIPIGIAATLAGMQVLKTKSNETIEPEPLDRAGSILMIFMLSCLITGLAKSSDWGVSSLKFVLCMAGAGIGLAGFVINENRVDFPLFDPALMRIRLFALPLAASGILFAALFVMVFLMPFYLTYPCGFSAARTGFALIVPFLFLMFISPVSGAVADRIGSRLLCTLGMGLMTVSLISLAFLVPDSGMLPVLWRMALAGMGTALFISPNNTTIMGSVPAPRRGVASGAVATSRNVGMVIGVALAGAVFSASFSLQGLDAADFSKDMTPGFMAGFRQAMVAGAVLASIGIVVSYLRGKELKNK